MKVPGQRAIDRTYPNFLRLKLPEEMNLMHGVMETHPMHENPFYPSPAY